MTPSIYQYSDYRAFLADVHRARKRAKTGWSHAVWARQLGLRSPSMLVMVLKGQRNPGDELIARLARHLGLGRAETEYFADLVRLQKVRGDLRLTTLLMERLARRHPQGGFHQIDSGTFAAMANWYYAAIRELARMDGFRETPAWICRRLRFRITPGEAGEAVRTLLRLGLLRRLPDGKLIATDQHVETPSDVVSASSAVRRFHEQALDNAKAALTDIAPDQREILGTSFILKPGKIADAKRALRDFLNTFCDSVEDPDGRDVYHLELALYPLTREVSA